MTSGVLSQSQPVPGARAARHGWARLAGFSWLALVRLLTVPSRGACCPGARGRTTARPGPHCPSFRSEPSSTASSSSRTYSVIPSKARQRRRPVGADQHPAVVGSRLLARSCGRNHGRRGTRRAIIVWVVHRAGQQPEDDVRAETHGCCPRVQISSHSSARRSWNRAFTLEPSRHVPVIDSPRARSQTRALGGRVNV